MTPCEERMSLVSTIEQDRGYPLAPRIREAFLNVSRYHFVPEYLKQEQPMIWVSYNTREVVYQDRVFVTKVNQKMMPCSSSTQPSLMAAMLEALDLFPEARVLEIGTGTGYNAALLSEIVGQSGSVMSIDVDEDLVCLAQQRMREAGYTNIQVAQADALASLPPSLFDRIILTGGYPTIFTNLDSSASRRGKDGGKHFRDTCDFSRLSDKTGKICDRRSAFYTGFLYVSVSKFRCRERHDCARSTH